jgi:hypothetical protein
VAVIATLILSTNWLVALATETTYQSPTDAVTAPQGEACALLTKQDAAAALGEAAEQGKELSNLPAGQGSTVSSCEYTGSGYHRVQLNVTRLSPSAAPMYRAMCAEKASKDLAGLGDVACWYNEKHEELHAIKAATFLSVELHRSGDPTEAIKGVMKKALDRLR